MPWLDPTRSLQGDLATGRHVGLPTGAFVFDRRYRVSRLVSVRSTGRRRGAPAVDQRDAAGEPGYLRTGKRQSAFDIFGAVVECATNGEHPNHALGRMSV